MRFYWVDCLSECWLCKAQLSSPPIFFFRLLARAQWPFKFSQLFGLPLFLKFYSPPNKPLPRQDDKDMGTCRAVLSLHFSHEMLPTAQLDPWLHPTSRWLILRNSRKHKGRHPSSAYLGAFQNSWSWNISHLTGFDLDTSWENLSSTLTVMHTMVSRGHWHSKNFRKSC